MKKKSFIIFLLILSNLCNFNLSYAAAYELPPDLLSKLHSNINVAELYASNNWGGSPIDYAGRYWYYNRIEIDPNSIYGSLSAYNVLIMAETSSGFLMTEQISSNKCFLQICFSENEIRCVNMDKSFKIIHKCVRFVIIFLITVIIIC